MSNFYSSTETNEEFSKQPSFDFTLTPECQKIVANKLNSLLDRTIDEVMVQNKKEKNKSITNDSGIYLFSSSTSRLSLKDIQENNTPPKPQKKPQLKKRRHIDGSESEDEESKIRLVAVSADWVVNSSCRS